MAADRGHDSGRDSRAAAAGSLCARVRVASLGSVLPDPERRCMLYGAERLRRRAPVSTAGRVGTSDTRIAETVTWGGALGDRRRSGAGTDPGLLAAGASMAGGLLVGLSNEDAARFAFLLATPIIGAAAVLKLPDLFGSDGRRRARPGARGIALRGADRLRLGAVPDAVLRDEPADAVRDLLRRRGHRLARSTSPPRSPAPEPTLYPSPAVSRAVSSVGRAPARQAGGHWFEPSTAHRLGIPLARRFRAFSTARPREASA